jgi:hypothetical protein
LIQADTIVKAIDDLTHTLNGRKNLKGIAQIVIIPKHPFTSVKIAEYFVRENRSNSGNLMNTMALLASALLVTLALQD